MRKNVIMGLFLGLVGFVGYKAYNNATMTDKEKLLRQNIEAIAQIEQPDVDDCINDPRYDCEALHPTDPTKG